jgi:hypothetical protein
VEVTRHGQEDQDQEHDDESVHVALSFLERAYGWEYFFLASR